MKLKQLEEYLQGVDGFEKPKLLLEQYITPSHIASNMLFTIQSKYDDLEGKTVADLGESLLESLLNLRWMRIKEGYRIRTVAVWLNFVFLFFIGCGSGMLSIGAFLLGSQYTVGFDIDRDALNVTKFLAPCAWFKNLKKMLQVLQRNINEMEIPGVDGVQIDVIKDLKESKWMGVFDTVLINPPFGTKHNAGMDIKFLETGIALATGAVYSLHKSSTR